MAKKSKKCGNPKCLFCRWWPRVSKHMGDDMGCYWVDDYTGEVFIATGLRVLPGGELIRITDDEGPDFYEVECQCGSQGFVRGDLLEQARTTCCPECAASAAQTSRN